jgi:hypothetical protein
MSAKKRMRKSGYSTYLEIFAHWQKQMWSLCIAACDPGAAGATHLWLPRRLEDVRWTTGQMETGTTFQERPFKKQLKQRKLQSDASKAGSFKKRRYLSRATWNQEGYLSKPVKSYNPEATSQATCQGYLSRHLSKLPVKSCLSTAIRKLHISYLSKLLPISTCQAIIIEATIIQKLPVKSYLSRPSVQLDPELPVQSYLSKAGRPELPRSKLPERYPSKGYRPKATWSNYPSRSCPSWPDPRRPVRRPVQTDLRRPVKRYWWPIKTTVPERPVKQPVQSDRPNDPSNDPSKRPVKRPSKRPVQTTRQTTVRPVRLTRQTARQTTRPTTRQTTVKRDPSKRPVRHCVKLPVQTTVFVKRPVKTTRKNDP